MTDQLDGLEPADKPDGTFSSKLTPAIVRLCVFMYYMTPRRLKRVKIWFGYRKEEYSLSGTPGNVPCS